MGRSAESEYILNTFVLIFKYILNNILLLECFCIAVLILLLRQKVLFINKISFTTSTVYFVDWGLPGVCIGPPPMSVYTNIFTINSKSVIKPTIGILGFM